MDWMEFYRIWSVKGLIQNGEMLIQPLREPKSRHYDFLLRDGTFFKGFLSNKNIKDIKPGLYPLWGIHSYRRNKPDKESILFCESGKIYIIHEYPDAFKEMCDDNERLTVNRMDYEDILHFFMM